jgi:hypothetical protein
VVGESHEKVCPSPYVWVVPWGGSFALANSPGFSLSETAFIVRIISQRIPFIFTDRVPAVFVPYFSSLIPLVELYQQF